jgi:hypothetical protein
VPWTRSFSRFFHVLDPGLADFVFTLRPDLSEAPFGLRFQDLPPLIAREDVQRVGETLQAGDEVSPEVDGLFALIQELNDGGALLNPAYTKRLKLISKIRAEYQKAMNFEATDFPGLPTADQNEGVAFFKGLSHFDLDALGTLQPLTVERVQELAWLNVEQKKWYSWLLTKGIVVGDKLKVFFEKTDADWKQLIEITENLMGSYMHLVEKERALFDRYLKASSRSGQPNPCSDFRF